MGLISWVLSKFQKTYKLYTIHVNHYLNDELDSIPAHIAVVAYSKQNALDTAREHVSFVNKELKSWFFVEGIGGYNGGELLLLKEGKEITLNEIDESEIKLINKKVNFQRLEQEFKYVTQIERDCTTH